MELLSETRDPEETDEMRQQRWYLRKVEGGGFVLQLCAMLMAWLAAEDKGMKKFIDEKVGLDEIRETVIGIRALGRLMLMTEQLKNMEEPDEDDENVALERQNAKEEREIMEVLIDVLQDVDKEAPTHGAS